MSYQYRDDHVPGWVYLLEAEGYHGIVPGAYLRRCKIGLTRSVENRLDTLHGSQPPCNYKLVKAIYVQDMAAVEDALHAQFKHRNVKLIKSREWFDIYPWQYAHVLWMFNRYDSKRNFSISPKVVASGLVALLGVGLLIGYSIREHVSEIVPAPTKVESKVKSANVLAYSDSDTISNCDIIRQVVLFVWGNEC